MKVIHQKSPNFNDRPSGQDINMLVLHYTGMPTGQEALERLCDEKSQVSAHYLIDEDGSLYCLVEEDKRAWHAGVSCWQGQEGVNDCSIGIEIVNPGHDWGYRNFPTIQMDTVISLSKQILDRYEIPQCRIIGHSDVSPSRKQDPGELFDWELLSLEGIGLWHRGVDLKTMHEKDEVVSEIDIMNFQKKLGQLGYKILVTGMYDTQTKHVIKAFQRHWLPHSLSGRACLKTRTVLDNLLSQR